MPVEYSQDGGSWTKFPTGEDVYERKITDFKSDQAKGQIQNQLVFERGKVEYSTDGGFSWVPFRFSQSMEENAARIYTMLQRNYEVRRVVVKQIGQAKVTQTDASNSTFFKAVNQANTKKPRVTINSVYVYRMQGGQYTFSAVDPQSTKGLFPDSELICTVRQRHVFSMTEPNENEVIYAPAGEVRNKAQMRVRGYVFRFLDPTNLPYIQHWWDVLKGTNPTFDPADYVAVKCAHLYDTDMDPFFEGLGPIVAVMGTQYILGWRNRQKFGDTWLIHKNLRAAAETRMRAKGAFVEVSSGAMANVENRKEEVDFTDKEVDPNYIMGIRTSFQEIVNIGTDQQIMDNLIKVIDFRNKCVDELKELNKVIEEARDKVRSNVANG